MFDRAVCLTLDKRVDNRSRVAADFSVHHIRPEFFIAGDGKTLPADWYDHVDVEPPPREGYPAWKERPNSYNAFLCHRRAVTRANQDGVQTLLLLEDDVVLTDQFYRVLPAAWEQLHEVDPAWEAFYLGANHAFSKTAEVAPNLLRLQRSGCWHAVCLHRRIFDKVLELPMTGPIDGVFAEKIQPHGHCYACWPNIAVTQPGFSYCEGREVDYSHFWGVKGC